MDTVLELLNKLTAQVAELHKDNKSIAKLVRKVRAHQEDPDGEKAKARAKNNGFNIPHKVTPEFSKFLGIGPDEMITRSQANTKIRDYVNANNLKNPENGRIIFIDDAMRALLEPPEGVQITYLNIQTYLRKHYIKNTEAAPSDSAASAAPVVDSVEEVAVVKVAKAKPVVKKAEKKAA